MRTKLLAAAFVLASVPAIAADMTPPPPPAVPYKAPPVYVPTFSWTGFYVGGNVGYGWGSADSGTISFFEPLGTLAQQIPGNSISTSGVIGGGQLGYNQQLGSWVLGIEADFDGSDIKGSFTNTVRNYTAHSQIDWLSTVRGRVGFAFDRWMMYGTGGVAIGSSQVTLDDSFSSAGVITTTSTNTHIGWTAGAGVSTMITQSWSLRLEYLHVDLGSKQYNHFEGSAGIPQIQYNASVTADIVRGGVDFKF